MQLDAMQAAQAQQLMPLQMVTSSGYSSMASQVKVPDNFRPIARCRLVNG